MRYFTIIDFQDMVLAFFLGLLVLVMVYISWSGYSKRKEDERELDTSNDTELISSHGKNPVAPVLVIIYAGIALWVVLYIVFYGILGGPVG